MLCRWLEVLTDLRAFLWGVARELAKSSRLSEESDVIQNGTRWEETSVHKVQL